MQGADSSIRRIWARRPANLRLSLRWAEGLPLLILFTFCYKVSVNLCSQSFARSGDNRGDIISIIRSVIVGIAVIVSISGIRGRNNPQRQTCSLVPPPNLSRSFQSLCRHAFRLFIIRSMVFM